MSYDRIPQELQALPQWVCWRQVARDNGKATKLPINVRNGKVASVTDPATWGTFNAALSRLAGDGSLSGIGFVFSSSGDFAGIDIDDANGNEALLKAHNKIIAAFPSYTELSPSGLGLHIIVRGKIVGSRKHGVEAYSEGRFFTFTGNVWRDLPIINCQPMLDELQHDLQPARILHTFISTEPERENDSTIINRMLSATNADKVRALSYGDVSAIRGGDQSGSAIDMALVNVIQFYTKNVEQIERLWLSTPHAQNPARVKKLQRADYRMRTIRLAFDRELPPIDLSALQAQWAAEAPMDAAANKGQVPPALGETSPAASAQVAPTAASNGEKLPAVVHPSVPTGKRKRAPAVNPYVPPSGLMGSIAQFIYDAAPRQVPEIALAGAIGWMAGVAGKAYNIGGAGLNVYIAMLASSGSGKEAIANGYGAIEDAIKPQVPCISEFMGPSNFASVPAMLRAVARHPSAVSVVSEFGDWIGHMVGNNANPVRAALKFELMNIYGKSGKRGIYRQTVYSDKANDINEIRSPALSLIGESTPSTFYRNITEQVIEDGFLPRFIVMEYEGAAQYYNEQAQYARVSARLAEDLAQFAARCLSLNAPVNGLGLAAGPHEVETDTDTAIAMRAFSRACTDEANAHDAEGLKNIWSRVHLNVAKLAALVAVGNNPMRPTITMTDFDWARELVLHSVRKITAKIDSGEVAGSLEARQWEDLRRCLRELPTYDDKRAKAYGLTVPMAHAGAVNMLWLNRRVSKLASYRADRMGETAALRRALQRAESEELLVPTGAFADGKRGGGKVYQANRELSGSNSD